MADHLAAPTQVQYPWRAAIRTAVAVGIPAVLAALTVIPVIIQIVLDEAGETLPDGIRVWLVGAAGLVTTVAVIITRVMAIPAVNALLVGLGLSAAPKGENPGE